MYRLTLEQFDVERQQLLDCDGLSDRLAYLDH